ncbi:MAG: ABC transporter substrate-binding protein, partial [Trueperaceae bacterium]
MKRLVAVLLVAVMSLASAQVTIGILAPLTGGSAGTGIAQKAGFDLALAEINAAGGVLGQPLRIIIEDDRADAATSVAAFEKLMTEDGVEFIG